MRTTIKVLLSFFICLSLFAVAPGCSTDTPIENDPETVDPVQPSPETPEKPSLSEELLGEWAQSETNFGSLASTSRVSFGASDSLTINWSETTQTNTPYTVAKGKYTVNGDSLKLEWKTVMTDSVLNTAFSTFYLSGKCDVTDNAFNYNYSVYDTDGGKLSGPHTMKFAKK